MKIFEFLRSFIGLMLFLTFLPPAHAADDVTPVPTAIDSAAPTATAIEHRSNSLKELGVASPLNVRGSDSAGMIFSLRRDRLVTSASLKLAYNASPSLLPEISHIKITLNGEVVATLPLHAGEGGKSLEQTVSLDPRYFTDYNKLSFELVGRSQQDCAGAWLIISNLSRLNIDLLPLAQKNDLALLPMPFFDPLDNTRLVLPFVFSRQPTFETLQPAGTLASWLGSLARWRGADFPVLLDQLPASHAIVFLRNHDQLTELKLPPVEGPTLHLMANPKLPWAKLLVIQGRDDNDLKSAVAALALGQAALSGQHAIINTVDIGARRKPYDAPNWLPSGTPITFRQLVENQDTLQVRGYDPAAINIQARLAPDLFVWGAKGIPLDLRYRYTPPSAPDASTLTVTLDGRFVRGYPLSPTAKSGEKKRLTLPLFDNEPMPVERDLRLPGLRPGSANLLAFKFTFDTRDLNECKAASQANVFAAIDEDSTIDLSQYPHYIELPELAAFAGSGFPFTKYADLAETVVVLPDQPSAMDMRMMLTVMGMIGNASGAPALRHRVIPAAEVARAADSELLVFDGAKGNQLLAKWQQNAKLLLVGNKRELMTRLNRPDANIKQADQTNQRISINAQGEIATLSGFESPLHRGRSVIAFGANGNAAALSAINAMLDPKLASRIQGDLTVFRDGSVESYRTSPRYSMGELPWWTQLWQLFSRHPLLLALAGIAVCLIAGYWLSVWQRRHRAKPAAV